MTNSYSDEYRALKSSILRRWPLSPERIWLASAALYRRGHRKSAFALKQLNWLLYRNSLHPGATVAPDVNLGHNSLGIVVDAPVSLGRRVKLWHNVTITARHAPDRAGSIVVEDDAMIGAGAIVVCRRGQTLRIGRGARVGAGAVVTDDIPPRATYVAARGHLIEAAAAGSQAEEDAA